MILASQSDSNFKSKIQSWKANVRTSLVVLLVVSFFPFDSISAITISGNASPLVQSVDASPPNLEQINQLISQMGASDYSRRNDAEQQLLKIGEPAITPLRQVLSYNDATRVPDSEIRLRAVRLLILIEREVQSNQIQDFVDGKSKSIRLDGWEEFSSIVGDEKNSRQLFVKTHDSRPEIFKAIAMGKRAVENEVHQVITRRLRVSANTNAGSLIGTLSAVLFMASHQRQWDTDQPATFIQLSETDRLKIRQVLVRPQMLSSLKGHRSAKEVRLLISSWLDSLSTEAPKSVASQIAVIDAYQFKNKSERCMAFAANTRLPGQMRADAIELFWRLSDQKTSELEQLFDDATVVGTYLPFQVASAKPSDQTGNERLIEVQIRDLALAVTILLNQQDIRNHGFYASSFENEKLVLNQTGFSNEQDRTKAFKGWSYHKQQTAD